MAKQLGNTLGQYQMLEEIGRGGMAGVYRAYQSSLQRYVAIKVLPPQFAADEAFVQRFLQEARAAAKLEHPHIVTIHDVGEVRGTYFIVMQLLQGEPLNQLIRREGKLPLERVARITQQIASALDYAHALGFVHRDVKPANIIVGPGDHATLTDFGIAKVMQSSRLTQTGAAIGTPEYMSPEQATGSPVGPTTDIYSLGLVAYEMLTGAVPFVADSTPAVLYKHVHERPAPARQKVPGLPASADKALARALVKDPAQRFRTTQEFAAALASVGPTRPLETPRAEERTMLAPALAKPATAAPAPAGSGLTKWALPVVGIAIAVVLATILLPNALRRDGSTPSAAQVVVDAQEAAVSPGAAGGIVTATRVSSRQATPMPRNTPTRPPGSSGLAGRPQVQPNQDIAVYTGPGRQHERAGAVEANRVYEIVGRAPDDSWLLVCCVDGEPVWIDANLVVVTNELGSVPAVTVAPSPTATSVPSPTPSRVPAATLKPTETPEPPTPEPTATAREAVATSSSSPPPPSGQCRPAGSLPPVTLISPQADKTCNGPVGFTWQWPETLRSGETFELHLWPNEKLNRNSVAQSTGTSLVTDISRVGWILWERPAHWWEIVVVCKSDGRWVSQESEPRLIYFDGRIPADPNNPDANCR